MAYPNSLDPANSDIDKVRVNVADTDPDDELISNDLYQYWLDSESDTDKKVNSATVEAVDFLVAKFARYTEEKTGEVQAKYQHLYEHYKDLSDRIKDPVNGILSAPQIYAGGISCADIEANNDNPDNNPSFPASGWVSNQFK